MSKLSSKAKKSKLSEKSYKEDITDIKPEQRVTKKITPKDYPRSYRLDTETINTLNDTLNKLNEISPKKITETRLIKALIALSKEIDEERLMKAIKEVW